MNAYNFTSQIEGIETLPFDLEKPNRAFRPYSQKASKAFDWVRANALPLLGLLVAVVL